MIRPIDIPPRRGRNDLREPEDFWMAENRKCRNEQLLDDAKKTRNKKPWEYLWVILIFLALPYKGFFCF